MDGCIRWEGTIWKWTIGSIDIDEIDGTHIDKKNVLTASFS